VVGLGGGDPEPGTTERADAPAAAEPRRDEEAAAPAAQRADGSSPEAAVRGFYTRAADGDLDGSWALAGPKMREQFRGSRARFEDTLGSLRSIEFRRLTETQRSSTTAVVAIETVAQHTNRTDTCSGTLGAVRQGSGWRVEPLGVRCTSG
jgi:hypothetical protein